VHAQNHLSLEWRHKYIPTIVLGEHDFLLIALNLGNLAAFMAILAIFLLGMRRNGYLSASG